MTDESLAPAIQEAENLDTRRKVLNLLVEQQYEAALALINSASPQVRETPRWLLMRARALHMANDTAGAKEALNHIKGKAANRANVLKLRLALAKAGGDLDETVSILRRLHEAMPGDVRYILNLARMSLSRGDAAEAETLARKAIELDPARIEAHRTLYLALVKTARPQAVADAVRAAMTSAASYPKYKGLRMMLFALEPSEAATLRSQLIAHWPESEADLEVKSSEFKQVVERALSGERDAALAHLRQAGDVDADPKIRDALDLIAAIPDPGEFKRALISDAGEEVITSAPSTNGVTVLFFTGLADRVGLDLNAIDAFCAASGAASIYLRDHSKMVFLMGVASLGPDRASTVAALREKLAALGTRELIVIGSSGGSYSSVTYGVELGAARIIGLGAQTSIHHFLKAGGDPRARLMIERIKDQFDPDKLDLRRLWGGLPNPPRLDLYFGAEHPDDMAHANHMAGLSNVFLYPIAGVKRHDVIYPVMQSGALRGFFEPSVQG